MSEKIIEQHLDTRDPATKPGPEEKAKMAKEGAENALAEGVVSMILLVERPNGTVAMVCLGSKAEIFSLYNSGGDQIVDMLRKMQAAASMNG
jgi:hypothetical protein